METLTTILQPKLEKLTPADYANLRFGEFYQKIPALPKAPKQAFVEAIAELCRVSQQTVLEKARVIDPFGHAGFDPSGKIRLTP